jgi:membrane protein required for colicin V production
MLDQFSSLDIVILVVIAVSVFTGLFRGFVKELFALGIWFLALWSGGHFSSYGAEYLKPWINQTELRLLASFVAIMLVVLVVGGLLSSLLAFLISRSGLSGTDRLLGMVFGFGRAVFIISLLIVVAKLSGFPEKQYTTQSKLYAEFNPVVNWLSSFAPGWLEKIKSLDNSSHDLAIAHEIDPNKIGQKVSDISAMKINVG